MSCLLAFNCIIAGHEVSSKYPHAACVHGVGYWRQPVSGPPPPSRHHHCLVHVQIQSERRLSRSPLATNCIYNSLSLSRLHGSDSASGKGSIASLLFGERAGVAHAKFFSRFGTWVLLLGILCELVNNFGWYLGINDALRRSLAAISQLMFTCAWMPVLHIRTLGKLTMIPEFWCVHDCKLAS